MAGVLEYVQRLGARLSGAAADVEFRIDPVTGAARLRRRPAKIRIFDYILQALGTLSPKWIAISVLLTIGAMFLTQLSAPDAAAAEAALHDQARSGDWAGGLRSLFILRMVASPRPLEFLVMITLTPMIWHAIPPSLRIFMFPVIAQALYMLVSQLAVIPLEFALLNLFTNVTDQITYFMNSL